LGGDSSDAAAVLRGLNKLWGLGLLLEELLELAAQLSSDASFFLYGGTALAEGRGEIVTPLPSLPHIWVVLMVPPVSRRPGKTEQLYASLKASHYTGGQVTDRLVTLLNRGGEVMASSLFNVFDEVALANFAGLDRYREQFLKAGAQKVHLAGSGPALFTLMEGKSQAEKIYENLQKQGLASYLSETLPAVEQVK
jgi:4-diphosphocytidyl-2-C-methyl-D-erythritol kinase